MNIELKFVESIVRTPSIKSFRFIPEPVFGFIPGQNLRIMFDPQNPKNLDLNKFLSFSCAPQEKYIEVTKRLTGSEFSTRLARLSPGDKVIIQAPLGQCIFRNEYKKLGFLIGGIGITPVISILSYMSKNNLKGDTGLLYSNRSEEEIAFHDVLDGFANENSNKVKVVYAVDYAKPINPAINFGRIDKELITRNMPDINQRVVFVYGPPGMVKAMQELALGFGCLKENLKTEIFVGY